MGVEIERKFLVKNASWRDDADAGVLCRQGYLVASPKLTVRVRLMGDHGFLTIKRAIKGIRRSEYEYPIPLEEAEELLNSCSFRVEKRRYRIEVEQHLWEVDVFSGANKGLVLAEVELTYEEESFMRPSWLGDEVSTDARYSNARLAQEAFLSWSK